MSLFLTSTGVAGGGFSTIIMLVAMFAIFYFLIIRPENKKKKKTAEETFNKIIAVTDKETKCKAVEQSKAYILGNWQGIMASMKSNDKNVKCSAEGHVSHVYADRMSSRPLGWCHA